MQTDGSDGAIHAAKFAAELARGSSAKVTIIAVYDDKVLALQELESNITHETAAEKSAATKSIKERCESRAEQLSIADTLTALKDVSDIEIAHRWGHTAEVVCNYAEENKVDLIVIGSRGMSGFRRLLLGSVSSQVVHHAPCAVTVVR